MLGVLYTKEKVSLKEETHNYRILKEKHDSHVNKFLFLHETVFLIRQLFFALLIQQNVEKHK